MCDTCKDQKIIEIESPHGIYNKRCECLREDNANHFFTWSGAESKYKKTIDELNDFKVFFEYQKDQQIQKQPVSVKSEMQMLLQDFKENKEQQLKILLKGTNGRGKTQFAVTLAYEILKQHMDLTTQDIEIHRFFFFKPIDLVNRGELFNQNRKDEIVRKISKSSVLIIDELSEELELGAEDKRKHEILRLLNSVLDSFNGLVIITTNTENPESKYQKENPRMHSRLFTKGSMIKYTFVGSGDDLRSKASSANKNKYENRF